MRRRPPRSTSTAPLLPYTTLFRSWPSGRAAGILGRQKPPADARPAMADPALPSKDTRALVRVLEHHRITVVLDVGANVGQYVERLRLGGWRGRVVRSEEHTSELQSLMRNSYAVFCLKKKNNTTEE